MLAPPTGGLGRFCSGPMPFGLMERWDGAAEPERAFAPVDAYLRSRFP